MRHVPTISVIVPVHNQEKYVGRCLRSAVNQKFPESECEILVIDDASTDRTRHALEKFGASIKVIHNRKKLGLPASLNVGIRKATGRLVVRIDADDYVHEEYLNILSLHLLLNGSMDAVACDYHLVDDDENVLATKNCMDDPIGCGIMFRIEHLIELGLYDERLQWHEDKDLRIRFLEKRTIDRVALPLYRYRRHDGNMTNNKKAVSTYMHKLERKHGKHKTRGADLP